MCSAPCTFIYCFFWCSGTVENITSKKTAAEMDKWQERWLLKNSKFTNTHLSFITVTGVFLELIAQSLWKCFVTIKSDVSCRAWLAVSSAGEQKPTEIYYDKPLMERRRISTGEFFFKPSMFSILFGVCLLPLIVQHQYAARLLTTPTFLFKLSINAQPLKAY